MDLTEDLQSLLSEQSRELSAAEAMDYDLDYAFRLQLEEALAASLAAHPSSSSAVVEDTVLNDSVLNASSLQLQELAKAEQEIRDRELTERETNKMKEDLSRRIHDQRVASEINRIPIDDWNNWGDNFEKPFDEGCSSETGVDENSIFRIYFKGLASDEIVKGERVYLTGIGVAICDPSDNLIFEISKSLDGSGSSKTAAEAKALIEAFNAAIFLDLKCVTYTCDYYPLFQFLNGRWPARQRKIAALINQVNLLIRKFQHCQPSLVARQDVKFAFKLARDAITSQTTRSAESSSRQNLIETCVICLEDTDVNQMFSVDGCHHRYCFSCMKQHVEVKLLHGMVPKCPHEQCNSELQVDTCQKFLTNKLVEVMQQRRLEASIPVTEKIYCPHPRCSALMSKNEVLEYSKNLIGDSELSGAKKCIKCHSLFCFSCKVPWHSGMTCFAYQRLNPNPPAEDVKLKFLATRSLWRQCMKCNHMIELAEGCYHMTCRCGNEFCYNCGAEWKNKKATCSCPLWAEDNIWFEDHARELEEDDDNYDDFDGLDDFFG